MLSPAQIKKAISLNRYYCQFLDWKEGGLRKTGWLERFDGICQEIGLTTNTMDETAFALAVARWQSGCGGLQVDGIIGTNTWAQLQHRTQNGRGRLYHRPKGMEPSILGQWMPPFDECATDAPMCVPARGFMFIVFETLPVLPDMEGRAIRKLNPGSPHVGNVTEGNKLLRKVAIIPETFNEIANANGTLSPAEHAFDINKGTGNSRSPWLSTSNRSHGAPNIRGTSVIIDLDQIRRAGGTIVSEAELIADLQRYQSQSGRSMERIIRQIRGVEGETLVRGQVRGSTVSPLHSNHIVAAENAWAKFKAGEITREALEQQLSNIDGQYQSARGTGLKLRSVGRALGVVGVVMTVVDLGKATNQSIEQQSFKPIAAESIRQAGGWGAGAVGGWATALAAAKYGGTAGAVLGLETGPGCVVTGAIGAIVFGLAGYWGADWIADKIHAN